MIDALFLLPKRSKLILITLFDLLAFYVSLWGAFALRMSDFWPETLIQANYILFVLVPIFGVLLFYFLGVYRAVVRFMTISLLRQAFVGIFLLVLVIYLLGMFYADPIKDPFSKSVPIIFGLFAWFVTSGARLALRGLYLSSGRKNQDAKALIIYGAGSGGAAFSSSLSGSTSYVPVCFVDDDPNKLGKTIYGLPVRNSNELQQLIEQFSVRTILVAIPSLSHQKRSALIRKLEKYPVEIKVLPPPSEYIDSFGGNVIRDVSIEEILERDVVEPMPELLNESIRDKSVLVTGGGGSIGAELARQSVTFGAKIVVVYEQSEFALYEIDRELSLLIEQQVLDCKVIPILGTVLDKNRLSSVILKYDIDTVYHAAAYKHVPLVEHNVLEGLRNNVMGTITCAEVAANHSVHRFVLISTDKAVRPTNVMGATKRLAELSLQSLAKQNTTSTIFSMVRFGNVLGSSGSVVPLFRKQIENGGPITVTHNEITRYFMTIPEAASLVIQAGSMAQGGEVFLLDMGSPVKIYDLAQRMISLSGRSVKDGPNPDGDIEIAITGLRPGEKLFEELLIGDAVEGTEHSKILKASEELLDKEILNTIVQKLECAISAGDTALARYLLSEAVSGFSPTSEDVDYLKSKDV